VAEHEIKRQQLVSRTSRPSTREEDKTQREKQTPKKTCTPATLAKWPLDQVVNREAKKQRGARLWRPIGISRCAPSLICVLKEKKNEPVTKSPLQQRQILTELNTSTSGKQGRTSTQTETSILISKLELKSKEGNNTAHT
jgi:hypothetical protein